MNQLPLEQIEKERLNGRIIMTLNILKSEIARMNRTGFSVTDNETISKWSGISLEEIKQLREICHVFNLENIMCDVALEEPMKLLTIEEAEAVLVRSVIERIHEVLETYPYAFEIIMHGMSFIQCEGANNLSEKDIINFPQIKEYAKYLYLGRKALYEYHSGKNLPKCEQWV